MQPIHPSNLIDQLLPLDALPERVIATSDATSPAARRPILPQRMTELMARLHGQFASQGVLVERIVQLFGGNPLGIAQRLPKGECICVNLARRIILDRAARERVRLPPDLLPFLDTLNNALIELAATDFPEIAQPETQRRRAKQRLAGQHDSTRSKGRRAILDFYLNTVGTPLQDKLGARVHLALARKSQGLIAIGTKDLQESLRAQIAPLRAMLRKDHPFDFIKMPALDKVDRQRSIAHRVLREIHAFFVSLPSERDKSRPLSAATANDYWGVLRAVLDPLVLGSGRQVTRMLQTGYASAWYRLLDDDPPEDEDDPYFRAKYLAAAEAEAAALGDDDEGLVIGDDKNFELAAQRQMLPLAQWLPRVNYARECAALQLHTTIYDTTSIPVKHLAMGYAAMLDAQLPIEKLPYHQLVPLALWHLLVTTGRDLETLLQVRVGTKPSSGACAHPIFDAAEQALFASPTIYPALPKHLREQPDARKDPDGYANWRQELRQHERVYQPVTLTHETALDDLGRWMLTRLAEQHKHVPNVRSVHLFQCHTGKDYEPMSHEAALAMTTHKVTAFIRSLIPDAPPITVARLRHTAWAHIVGESRVHPILMQLQTDRKRMELYSHSFYACVSRQQLRRDVGLAQEQLGHQIKAAYSEGAPSWSKFLGKPAAIWPSLLRSNTQGHTDKSQPQSSNHDIAEHYGARYCPRFDIIKQLVLAELHNLANATSLHETHEAKAQAWHDALVYLVVLLSAMTGGTRIGEIVELGASAVDLDFTPPLVTLLGKANRFTEESRTQCVLPRLLPLWQMLFEPSNFLAALMVHTKRGRLRPISRRDVWEHLRAIGVQAGIATNEADYAIRFHACRHFTISWLIAHGSRFKDEGYWFGHQTAGNELLHPIAGSDLRGHWDEMTTKLHELLDALGVTEAVVQAIAARDVEALRQVLPPLPQRIHKPHIHAAIEAAVEEEEEEETNHDINNTPIVENAIHAQ